MSDEEIDSLSIKEQRRFACLSGMPWADVLQLKGNEKLKNAIKIKEWADSKRQLLRLGMFTAYIDGMPYYEWLQMSVKQIASLTIARQRLMAELLDVLGADTLKGREKDNNAKTIHAAMENRLPELTAARNAARDRLLFPNDQEEEGGHQREQRHVGLKKTKELQRVQNTVGTKGCNCKKLLYKGQYAAEVKCNFFTRKPGDQDPESTERIPCDRNDADSLAHVHYFKEPDGSPTFGYVFSCKRCNTQHARVLYVEQRHFHSFKCNGRYRRKQGGMPQQDCAATYDGTAKPP
jgi:hypothetical protein